MFQDSLNDPYGLMSTKYRKNICTAICNLFELRNAQLQIHINYVIIVNRYILISFSVILKKEIYSFLQYMMDRILDYDEDVSMIATSFWNIVTKNINTCENVVFPYLYDLLSCLAYRMEYSYDQMHLQMVNS